MFNPRSHELKIMPQYLDAVLSGEKTAEVRVNDRDYQRGDVLLLRPTSGGGPFTFVVTHVLALPFTEFGTGLVVLSIAPVEQP